MNIQSLQSVQQHCDGVAAIDYFFAQAVISLGNELESDNLPLFMALIALSYAQRHGHSCLPLNAIENQTWWQNSEYEQLGFTFGGISDIQLNLERLILSLPKPTCVRLQNSCLYTERYWQFEQTIQAKLNRMHRIMPVSQNAKSRLDTAWPKLFPNTQTKTDIDWQQVAVALASLQGLTVLSGGPGTGKTYTVARILLALQTIADIPLKIELAAPTGKAAKRLSESLSSNFSVLSTDPEMAKAIQHIPTQAQTVHRLLGLRETDVSAKYNAEHRLSLDVLVVDESSMLDLALMTRLLRALPEHCRLILVGDAQQLPSVESGNVLAMLMPTSENLFTQPQQEWLQALNILYEAKQHQPLVSHNACILLAQSFRFGLQVAEIANSINAGDGKQAWQTLVELSHTPDSGIKLIQPERFRIDYIRSICDQYFKICSAESLAEAFVLSHQFRVLTAIKQGDEGTESLNEVIENGLRLKLGMSAGTTKFKGQLLMVSRNVHALGLYNGDIGIVWPDDSGKLLLFFETDVAHKFESFDLSRVPATQSVYAMTIHKSQGSEFEHVTVVLPSHMRQNLLSRELLYTAVTRSKSKLSLVCNESVYVNSVDNVTQRFSGLKQGLRIT